MFRNKFAFHIVVATLVVASVIPAVARAQEGSCPGQCTETALHDRECEMLPKTFENCYRGGCYQSSGLCLDAECSDNWCWGSNQQPDRDPAPVFAVDPLSHLTLSEAFVDLERRASAANWTRKHLKRELDALAKVFPGMLQVSGKYRGRSFVWSPPRPSRARTATAIATASKPNDPPIACGPVIARPPATEPSAMGGEEPKQ